VSVRLCEGCGLPLDGKRRDARFHNSACRMRKHRRGRRDITEVVWALRFAGEIDGVEALLLLVDPPVEVREQVAA
jgi:hypothetical protein